MKMVNVKGHFKGNKDKTSSKQTFFNITPEIKRLYKDYMEKEKARIESNIYDARSSVYRQAGIAEKKLERAVKEEGIKQAKSLVKRLGFDPDELELRYSAHTGISWTNKTFNPYFCINTNPGWYNRVICVKSKKDIVKLKQALKKRKEEMKQKKIQLEIRKK